LATVRETYKISRTTIHSS